MRRLLPAEEFQSFVEAYERPLQVGLRVNTLKISVADFTSIAPFSLAPAGEWDPAQFVVTDDSRPGRHPYHDAGLYYLQEPSAMVAASLLAPSPGDLVLDLAAAPGGKATHLAALMQTGDDAEPGLLVANDVHPGRARLLADNLARWRVNDVLVTQDEPDRLAAAFGPIFDRVLIDAPCSGEGMFRRQPGIEWSESIVQACARRQSHILTAAPRLVRPGGHLLYTTCTFSPEENEAVIAGFLAGNPDFRVEDPPRYAGFDRGRPEWVQATPDISSQLSSAVRLWPHRFPGEGHFLALLRREGDRSPSLDRWSSFKRRKPTANELSLWHSFARETLTLDLAEDRFHVHDGRLYLLPHRTVATGRLHIIRLGLVLGELRAGYFRPGHELALALTAGKVTNGRNWPADAPETRRFLAGEDMENDGRDGWVLVSVDGYGLSWGKRVKGRLKNHFPRHLRRLAVD